MWLGLRHTKIYTFWLLSRQTGYFYSLHEPQQRLVVNETRWWKREQDLPLLVNCPSHVAMPPRSYPRSAPPPHLDYSILYLQGRPGSPPLPEAEHTRTMCDNVLESPRWAQALVNGADISRAITPVTPVNTSLLLAESESEFQSMPSLSRGMQRSDENPMGRRGSRYIPSPYSSFTMHAVTVPSSTAQQLTCGFTGRSPMTLDPRRLHARA